jgi:hypothetical protein
MRQAEFDATLPALDVGGRGEVLADDLVAVGVVMIFAARSLRGIRGRRS